MRTVGLATDVRSRLFLAGGALLASLALLFLLVSLVTGGGVGIIILSLPILLASLSVLRGWPLARVAGVTLGALYTVMIGYVATTPWRGATPPPGQVPQPLEPSFVALTIAFAVATVLMAVGTSAVKKR